MTNRKSTKKALLMSALSLLLCCSMLIGTTFAWFTDEVTSGVNQIVAGNLDVDVVTADNQSIEGVETLFNDVTLWEPGAVAYEVLTVQNLGTLALKYQMSVNFDNENTVNGYGLSQILKIAVVDAAELTDRDSALAAAKAASSAGTLYDFTLSGNLNANDHTTDTYGIVIWWEPSDADNNWNVNNGKTTSDGMEYLHIDLGIKLVATQLNAEEDSYGPDYDKDAWADGWKVYNAQDLQAAINNGETYIILMDDIVVDEPIVIPAAATTYSLRTNAVVLDLNGKTLSNPNDYVIVNYGNVVITGNGKVIGLGGINSESGSVTIENGTIAATARWNDGNYKSVIRVANSSLTINGGIFDSSVGGGNNALINVSNNAVAVVNGGTFRSVQGENDAAAPYLFEYKDGAALTINDGDFSGDWRFNFNAKTDIYGGTFTVNCDGQSFQAGNPHVVTVYGGTFTAGTTLAEKLESIVAANYQSVNNGDGTYTVLPDVGEENPLVLDPKSGLYYNGKATCGTYYIFDKEDLIKAAEYFVNQDFTTEGNICNIELVADIDLAGETWTPWSVMWINFDGNGHTISNVTTTESWRAGLFGYLGASKVENLTLKNVVTNGAQAGVLIGSAEGVTTNNCYIVGENTVNYVEYVSPSYTESWGGIGAVVGVVANSTLNVEIADGATITVNKGVLITNCTYVNDLTGYLQANKGTVTNNGTVIVNGSDYAFVADGLGKKDGAYYVSNANGLATLNTMLVNKTAGKGVIVNIMADIDFSGKTWTPVDSHVDYGCYLKEWNGNGHTISNLTVNGQAMFTRFSCGAGVNVVIKDITFDKATVKHSSINTALIVGHTYNDLTLDNVDVKNSSITGGYKVAPLIGTVYNESESTITATLKNCDVENVVVTATKYDFFTCGMVSFVYTTNNDFVEYENCSVTNVQLRAVNVYSYHANIHYTSADTDDQINEHPGVTVTNVTFENI